MGGPLASLALRETEDKPPLLRARTLIIPGEEPDAIEVEANLDPVEIGKAVLVGVGAAGAALLAGGVAWLVWDGVALPSPFGGVQVFRGLKENETWRDAAIRTKDILKRRAQRLSLNPDARARRCIDIAESLEQLEEVEARWLQEPPSDNRRDTLIRIKVDRQHLLREAKILKCPI